jgi:ATP-dependent DNA helicase RecG
VDLDLRGGGQLLGTRQHGVSDLRFAHMRRDRQLLEQARTTAQELGPATGPLADEIDALFAETDSGALA